MSRPAFRPRLLTAALAAAVLAAGCSDRVGVSGTDAAWIRQADRAVDSLHALAVGDESARSVSGRPTPARLDTAGAHALLYLERARLGLGSPFQLAERAASDPQLAGLGRTIAWALLGRAARGEVYQIDAPSLGDATDPWLPGAQTDGAAHRALIDSTVARAPSARTGELTIRLAYTLARAERLVPATVADAATPAAALARDRRLAREDAARLLAARAADPAPPEADALALLVRWRRERRVAAERPLLADDLRPDQAAAPRAGERLLVQLRAGAARTELATVPDSAHSGDSSATASARSIRVPGCAAVDGWLPCRAASMLAATLADRPLRPDPYVTITLGGYRSDLPASPQSDDSSATESESLVIRRLAARARTADALAAEWVRLRATVAADAPVRRRLGRLVHGVAVAARPFAQAPVVAPSPGTATLGVAETADRIRLGAGISRIAFDRGLAPAWRVPALLDLESALADLRLALPGLGFDGLGVRIGASPKGDLALALHDPADRTIYLPPASGAGTVAHELAHDLDWQTARTQLGLRGTYATDRAARLGAEPLATAVRALADTRNPRSGRGRATADRPAELFARGVDWYVAAMLAREGRMNGVLTSVQDLDLPGFAGATAPIPGTGAGEAIVDALGRVTPLPPVGVQWFRARFGPTAPLPATAIARLALDAPSPWSAERVYLRLGLPAGLTSDEPPTGASAESCPLAPWQRRLLWVAADARARGMVRSQASRAAIVGPTLWRSRTALGFPWREELAEEPRQRFRDAVLRGSLRALRQHTPFADPVACR
ncbi:hypothetical protein [Roseisolibacter sp. H3M3-2]|uniref:hypothetical protein n=1 Tax=Roseisolibacter sp. H3M3-2 TaxID=3031323 RepID=UPI0023DC19EF|nr:hypothetical protein [Roseisolibacter sp. H3M3-2]MDF1501613.1 hypothetical protein [Roseisolibacter sp. H3M3-2]